MQEYEEIRRIGKGSYGEVFLCRNTKTLELVADKRIETEHLSDEEREVVYSEAMIMDKLIRDKHANVVRFIGHCHADGVFCLYMEYCSGGSLGDLLRQRKREKKRFVEAQVWNYLSQIASGLLFIHSKNVIHRDLKPENILKTEHGMLKIADFGVSSGLAHHDSVRRTLAGTVVYMAPEMIKRTGHNVECDVWSLGVITYEMITFRSPFVANNVFELSTKILEKQFDPVDRLISDYLQSLLDDMLNKDPLKRPTSQAIAEMGVFFADVYEPDVDAEIAGLLTRHMRLDDSDKSNKVAAKLVEKQPTTDARPTPQPPQAAPAVQLMKIPVIPPPPESPRDRREEALQFCKREYEKSYEKKEFHWTLLHHACKKGAVVVVKLLLERGESVSEQDTKGYTALHRACIEGHAEIVRLLLDYGADIEAKDKFGSVPLHAASYNGHLEVIKLLVQRRAFVNARSIYKMTPLTVARTDPVRNLLRELGAY